MIGFVFLKEIVLDSKLLILILWSLHRIYLIIFVNNYCMGLAELGFHFKGLKSNTLQVLVAELRFHFKE